MTRTNTADISLIELLVNYGDLKVWSVLVTILGDLAPRTGMYIPGPALAALTGRIGIKPQALRVALHRLRKEGWVEGTKFGRISHYSLSEMGRAETKKVEPQVYGDTNARKKKAHMLITSPRSTDDIPAGAIKLSRNTYLSDHIPNSVGGLLSATPEDKQQWPHWVQEAVLPAELAEQHEFLATLLSTGPAEVKDLEPFDRLALRILILHNWRRLVLRRSPLAPLIWDSDWIGARCQDQVKLWLNVLSRDAAQKSVL